MVSSAYPPKIKQVDVAVNILDAIINIAWSNRTSPGFIAAPTAIANNDTIKAATMAWTCTNEIFPTIIRIVSVLDVILPRFACVDSRDDRHMSRLPLRPSKAGTNINNWRIFWNTSHFCYRKNYNKTVFLLSILSKCSIHKTIVCAIE